MLRLGALPGPFVPVLATSIGSAPVAWPLANKRSDLSRWPIRIASLDPLGLSRQRAASPATDRAAHRRAIAKMGSWGGRGHSPIWRSSVFRDRRRPLCRAYLPLIKDPYRPGTSGGRFLSGPATRQRSSGGGTGDYDCSMRDTSSLPAARSGPTPAPQIQTRTLLINRPRLIFSRRLVLVRNFRVRPLGLRLVALI